MPPLATHADQAVRHAVDAYIDGRLLPTFEGDSSFETRNSRYRMLDGVLLAAPDQKVVGAEMVGWLIEYVARSEVVPQWKPGARAILVDTRNDGVRGPQIVVTSATRTFRGDRIAPEAPARSKFDSAPRATFDSAPRATFDSAPRATFDSAPRATFDSAPRVAAASAPRIPYDGSSRGLLPATAAPPLAVLPPAYAGSFLSQLGSTMPPPSHASSAWETLPPPAPVPSFHAASHATATSGNLAYGMPHATSERSDRSRTLPPPPPPLPAYRQPGTIPPPPMVMSRATPPPPPPRPLPRAAAPSWHQPLPALPVPLPPQPPAFADEVAARKIVAALESSMIQDDQTEDSAPTLRNERRGTGRLTHGRGATQRDPRQSSARLPPPSSVPFLLSRTTISTSSRTYQRGMPLR